MSQVFVMWFNDTYTDEKIQTCQYCGLATMYFIKAWKSGLWGNPFITYFLERFLN